MSNVESFVSAAGLIIILAVAALVFRTAVRMVFGKRRNQALLGLQFTILFAVAFGFHEPIAVAIGLARHVLEIGQALAALLWFSVAFTVTGALNRYVWRGILAVDGKPSVPRLLTDSVQVLIYLTAIMIVMHFVYDQSITALVATSGAFAFIIGYSAQSTLAELFAGISLNLARSIKKGDIVSIDGTFGRVADINWRCVSIAEPKSGSIVVLPNSQVAGTKFTNYSLPEPIYRRAVFFTVEFSAPPDLVIRVTTEHLRRARSILSEPAPLVHVREYTPLGIEYRALWYIRRDSDWWPAWNEAHEAIWSALRAEGIQPGLNHRDAGEGGRFDDNAWSVRRCESEGALGEVLSRVTLFQGLPKTTIDKLAASAVRHDLGVTDTLPLQDGANGPLFVVASGRVAMIMTDGAGQPYTAAELLEGDVFGLAHAPGDGQPVTAQAIQSGIVHEIPAATVSELLLSRKTFLKALDAARVERNEAYEAGYARFLREQARDANKADKQKLIAGLAGQVKELFSGGFRINLRSLLTGGDTNEDKLLIDAIMAAAALVAAADGEVEPEERQYVLNTLETLNILEQAGVRAEDAYGNFDAHCARLASGGEDGVAEVLDVVAKIAANRKGAELLVGIGEAVSAADGEMEPAEEARIGEIRRLLNVGNGDDAEG